MTSTFGLPLHSLVYSSHFPHLASMDSIEFTLAMISADSIATDHVDSSNMLQREHTILRQRDQAASKTKSFPRDTMSVRFDIGESAMKSAEAERMVAASSQPQQGLTLGGDDSSSTDEDGDGLRALLKLAYPAKHPSFCATNAFGGGYVPRPPKAVAAHDVEGQMDCECIIKLGGPLEHTAGYDNDGVAASAPKDLPHDNDVLMGRGCGSYGHKGNKNFQKVIEEHRPSWKRATEDRVRDAVARRVLMAIGQLDPPGRFLARHHMDLSTPSWCQVEERQALHKVKEAFREKTMPASLGMLVEVRNESQFSASWYFGWCVGSIHVIRCPIVILSHFA
jgi:hypothetical protein